MSSTMLPTHVMEEMPSPSFSAPLAPRFVTFGQFQLDLQLQLLRKEGRGVRLHGKPLEILRLLVERRRELVTRQELGHLLWPPDSQVNRDANLNTLIAKLRRALGDSPDQPLFIETVPRIGYRFVGDVACSPVPAPEIRAMKGWFEIGDDLQPWTLRAVLGWLLLGIAVGASLRAIL